MNYYERHLGDYAKDAGHLTMLEHGAYTLLLDRYYTTEQPIPADQAHRVARARTDDEKAAVDVVLQEFFTLQDGAWRNDRAEEEITKAKARIEAARTNGKRGGRPKSNQDETQEKPNGFPVGIPGETQQKAHHTPYTTNTDTNVSVKAGASLGCPDGVSAEVWADFLKIRKAKRAPITETALAGIRKEAGKAGVGLGEALAICCERGWQGFKADWVNGSLSDRTSPARRPSADNFAGKDYGESRDL